MPPCEPRADCSGDLNRAAQEDPTGHKVHAAMAAVCVGLLPITTAGSTIALVVLMVYACLRLHCTAGVTKDAMRRPVVLVSICLVVWWATTLLWSPAESLGVEHLRATRWLVLPLLVWPVIEYRSILMLCMLVGVAGLNVSQFVEVAGQYVESGGFDDRVGGLMTHEPFAGLWSAVGIVGWSVLLMVGARWLKMIAAIGLMLATAGVVVAGGRGAWVALAATILVMVPLIWVRWPHYRRPVLIAVAIAPVVATASWPILGGAAIKVYKHTRYGVTKYFETGNAAGHQMIRLMWAQRALSYWSTDPIEGVGLGGFSSLISKDEVLRDASIAANRNDRSDDPDWRGYTAEHPHNTYLVALTETGLIGFGLLVSLLIFAWRLCWNIARQGGVGLALLGWMLLWLVGAAFDCYMYAGQMVSLLAVIVSLSMAGRVRGQAGRDCGAPVRSDLPECD
ncbi:MAG: O-antigen ligase family protein [Phycisphaerales bacterium]|jgi:O-antigen ligase|nr:O-antigen ligase family protein [Phycisphaerales bacterium]